MRVFADLDPDTYDRIEEAVREGKYSNVDQFIRVAVENQLNIEKSTGEGHAPSRADQEATNKSDGGYSWGYSLPNNPPVSSPFEMDRVNEMFFQQYYTFFPLVPVMVELGKETNKKGEPVVLSEFRDHVAETIEPLRDVIVDWEERNDVKKTNRKSTGLPKQDVKNPEYSMKRFLDHFVGKVRKRDLTPQSFSHTLGFVSYDPVDEEKTFVQLTPAGERFLRQGNPILSEGPDAPALSTDEQRFILTHIESTLPAEYQLMEFVYDTIDANGNNTYTNRLDDFTEYLMENSNLDNDASEERIRSHISGALSRMVELGILDRGSKRGVYQPSTPPEKIVVDQATAPA
jgi:Arc/MetJ-type ribon-helix-helix transcriptional regulator